MSNEIPDSGLTALLAARFTGRPITAETCVEVEHAVREHLREMLIDIDDNPPIEIRVESSIHNTSRSINVQALNFFTFLAMNGVTVNHMRVDGATQWVSGNVTYKDFGLGSYGVVVKQPVEGINGNYYFESDSTEHRRG